MVSGTEVIAAMQGLKAASDLVYGLAATAKEVAINEVKINLTRHLTEVQHALMQASLKQSESDERMRQLEQEIARLKDWSEERQRYELVAIRGGAFAYMPKVGGENGEPAHWLCSNCFDNSHKSIMQNRGQAKAGSGEETFACGRCDARFIVMSRTRPSYDQRQNAAD